MLTFSQPTQQHDHTDENDAGSFGVRIGMLGSSSTVATGDLNGNVQRLRRELSQVKFVGEIDDVG